MLDSRREIGKLALAGLPAAAVFGSTESIFGAFAQAKPNSLINGVQIGTITYSYPQHARSERRSDAQVHRRLRHQRGGVDGRSGRTLRAARRPQRAEAAVVADGATWRAGAAAVAAAVDAARMPAELTAWREARIVERHRVCAAPAPDAAARRRRRRRTRARRERQTPEQQAAQQAAGGARKAWRMGLSMDIFKDLRKMYNDAGVSIYAVKDVRQGIRRGFRVHVRRRRGARRDAYHAGAAERPNAETLKRLGDWA